MGIRLSSGGLTESQKASCKGSEKAEAKLLAELLELPINRTSQNITPKEPKKETKTIKKTKSRTIIGKFKR